MIKDGSRVNAKGEALDIEFLIIDPTSERIIGPYVEEPQAHRRHRRRCAASIRPSTSGGVKAFDYDIITTRFVDAPDARHRAASQLLGQRDRRHRAAAAISPASRTRWSMR